MTLNNLDIIIPGMRTMYLGSMNNVDHVTLTFFSLKPLLKEGRVVKHISLVQLCAYQLSYRAVIICTSTFINERYPYGSKYYNV